MSIQIELADARPHAAARKSPGTPLDLATSKSIRLPKEAVNLPDHLLHFLRASLPASRHLRAPPWRRHAPESSGKLFSRVGAHHGPKTRPSGRSHLHHRLRRDELKRLGRHRPAKGSGVAGLRKDHARWNLRDGDAPRRTRGTRVPSAMLVSTWTHGACNRIYRAILTTWNDRVVPGKLEEERLPDLERRRSRL